MSSEVVDEWASTTLKEAAAELFTDGDWVESKDQDPDGEVRLIQLADIGDGAFLNKSARFLTTDKARELRCTLLQPGDLLIARMADPIARCCLFPGLDQPAATVVDVSIIRPGREVDREYLAYAVSNPVFRSEALGSASGTTRSRISRSNLGAISVPLPPLDEQRRIAEVLGSVDEAVTAAECATQGVRHVFATVRAELLEGARAECAEVLVADAIAKNRGQKITKLQTADYLDEGAFPIIDQGSSFICGFSNDANAVWPYDLPVIVFGDHTRILKFVDFPFVIGADGTQCITPATDLDARYLYYALQSLDLRGEGYARHFKLLKERSIPVPPLVEQVQIAEQLLSLENAIGEAEAATERLLMVKRALMSDLLTGHVRVLA